MEVAILPLSLDEDAPAPSPRRELAYQLWAWEHGQNCAPVAEALGVSARAVQKWRRREGWDARLNREAAALRAELVATTGRRLLFGAVRVVEVLERVALGLGDDGRPASPPIPWPARVNAAKEFLSVAGLGRGAAASHAPAPAWLAPVPAPGPPAPLPEGAPADEEEIGAGWVMPE